MNSKILHPRIPRKGSKLLRCERSEHGKIRIVQRHRISCGEVRVKPRRPSGRPASIEVMNNPSNTGDSMNVPNQLNGLFPCEMMKDERAEDDVIAFVLIRKVK